MFSWLVFEDLSRSTVSQIFSEKNPDDIEYYWRRWMLEYAWSATLFYRSQPKMYYSYLVSEFCRHRSIKQRIFYSEEFDGLDEWNDYMKEQEDYRKCQQSCHRLSKHYAEVYRSFSQQLGSPLDMNRIDLEYVSDVVTGKWTRSTEDLIKSAWFDQNTKGGVSSSSYQDLRSMPYADYLQSPHWKRIRAAMLLLGKATCEKCDFLGVGESYYGGHWEPEIHVHHKHYRNRGQENYEDLILLCHRHHALEHQH